MGRTGHRVFRHAVIGREKARDHVVRGRRRRARWPAASRRRSASAPSSRSAAAGFSALTWSGVSHTAIRARAPAPPLAAICSSLGGGAFRLLPSAAANPAGGVKGSDGADGSDITLPRASPRVTTSSPERVWKRTSLQRCVQHVEDDPGAGQGGMAAQIHLAVGREPAQVISARRRSSRRTRFRRHCSRRRCACIRPASSQLSSGTMAAGLPSSGLAGKGIDLPDLQLHARPSVRERKA